MAEIAQIAEKPLTIRITNTRRNYRKKNWAGPKIGHIKLLRPISEKMFKWDCMFSQSSMPAQKIISRISSYLLWTYNYLQLKF